MKKTCDMCNKETEIFRKININTLYSPSDDRIWPIRLCKECTNKLDMFFKQSNLTLNGLME